MNEKQLKHILMFLEMGTWAARKALKKINEGEMVGCADYWVGVAETLEEVAQMIDRTAKEGKE